MMTRVSLRSWLPAALALSLVAAGTALARNPTGTGPTAKPGGAQEQILNEVRLDQQLDAQVPLDIPFRDEHGSDVVLGDYFRGKPVMLVMIQYRCTMLCSEQMMLVQDSLRELKFTPGKEFTFLIVSIDPREQPSLAAEFKQSHVEAYGRPEAEAGWHFLTGTEEAIDRLAQAVGFHYMYDARTDQYAHPDGVMILTPSGKIARYFFSLNYPARDLRLGLLEAGEGKIGSPILNAIALLCYHYNPETGTYGFTFMKLLRLLALGTVFLLAACIVVLRRRERPGGERERPV